MVQGSGNLGFSIIHKRNQRNRIMRITGIDADHNEVIIDMGKNKKPGKTRTVADRFEDHREWRNALGAARVSRVGLEVTAVRHFDRVVALPASNGAAPMAIGPNDARGHARQG
uniref:Uncharacterized protein n=1 Tax=Candidatus Kentrum sp. DK TaxID=2126562 RepID=A0A450SWA8_9GAMM|nr:MAG: hypothetical protein BECKDK2373B_GA0170837_107224 [Candidatus Kentron sp. DK]